MNRSSVVQIGSHTVSFERRRYGGREGVTYTWAYLHQGATWVCLGDPWPVLRPSNTEIQKAIAGLEDKP